MDVPQEVLADHSLGVHTSAAFVVIFLVMGIKKMIPESWNRALPLFVVMISFAYAFLFHYFNKTQELVNPMLLGSQIAAAAISIFSGAKTVFAMRSDQKPAAAEPPAPPPLPPPPA
ncbi:MAG TPA: hypothetical protein VJ547_12120 [Candidatus Thermoplasmatota archaeon]|nr:hypothetical protein [Candidatus Thermoplasmatota archaeon]